MKKRVFIYIAFTSIIGLRAQVGIGTTSPNAELHVETEASATSERTGIRVDLNSTSIAQQNTYSLYLKNSSSPSLIAGKYGIYNWITGTGDADRYGIYNRITQPTSGPIDTDIYGLYNIIGQSTGVSKTSYGVYSSIINSGNTSNIFGVYSIVNGSTSSGQSLYSGYFLGGRFAIGQTDSDTYELPESRGTEGQIMQTDGSGNMSWINNYGRPVSTIPIYVQHDTAGYQMNNTSGQDLFRMNSSLEPSIYNSNGVIEVKLVIRYTSNTAGTTNLQLRTHNGLNESFPIVKDDAWTFSSTQNGGVATSPWKTFNAGLSAHEIHVFGWVDNGTFTIVNAYLLVRSQE